MTIDEAVEILTLDKALEFEGSANDLEDALQLGIEALKWEKECRENAPRENWLLLPGETKE